MPVTSSCGIAAGTQPAFRLQFRRKEVLLMALGENIKARRNQLKLSQEFVADQLGISRQPHKSFFPIIIFSVLFIRLHFPQCTDKAVYLPQYYYNKRCHGKACHKIPDIGHLANI